MLKVGFLVGQERSFPDAVIEEINDSNSGVVAEYIKTGQVSTADSPEYQVILDRISHEVVFYQPFLKAAVLNGTEVINNPFWRLADDKFFGTVLLQKLEIPVPKTLIIPSHSYPDGIVSASLSNLRHPLDWEGMLEFTGLPAILKPHWGGGWKSVHRVDSLQDLLDFYNASGTLCMMLQEFIQWEQYVRCICIGKKKVLVANWDPRRAHFERYGGDQTIEPALKERIASESIRINEALGYDMNTIEFAVRDGAPYAIDFMNSAPDFDIASLTETYFPWVVTEMAQFLIERAKKSAKKRTAYRWDKLINIK